METLTTKISTMQDKTDLEIVEILNQADLELPTKVMPITIKDIVYHLQVWGVYANLQYYARKGEGAIAELAIKTLSFISPDICPFEEIDVRESDVVTQFSAMGAALIAAELITQAQYDILWDLRNVPQSWAEYNNVIVTPRTVAIARGANAGVN
jgi:hypothetical protein